jgi:two-component system, NarL family, sensor kinase
MALNVPASMRQSMANEDDARTERAVQQAREDERRRIARDLHDDISQQITLLTIAIDRLRERTALSDPATSESLHAMTARAQDIGSRVRQVSHQLHASTTEDLGRSVRALCQELAAHYAIDIHLACDRLPLSIPSAVALQVFRIAQEALQNAVRHSGARRVAVEVKARSNVLLLTVADEGRGFDVERAEAGGLGLVSMRDRLEALGGQLSVSSAPLHGTRIEARVPIWTTETAAA